MGSRAERRARTIALLASEDELEDLFAVISGGKSLRDYCVVKDVPYATVQEHLAKHHAERYQLAMDNRAEWQREQIEKITEEVEAGSIDPKAAAVSIGSRQWLAKTMNRKRYGDQQVVDVLVTDKTRLHLEAIRKLARTPRKVIATVVEQQAIAAPNNDNVMDAAFTDLTPIKALGGIPI